MFFSVIFSTCRDRPGSKPIEFLLCDPPKFIVYLLKSLELDVFIYLFYKHVVSTLVS